MKKVLVILFLNLLFCSKGFTESYYFKECKINEKYYANYSIDLEQNIINVSFVGAEGIIQKLTDKIQLVTEDRISSEIIQNKKKKKHYFQYYLDANFKSVTRQGYIKTTEEDLLRPDGPQKKSYCVNVKADWSKSKKKQEVKNKKLQGQSLKIESSLPECQGSDLKQWKNCQGTYITKDKHKYIGQYKDGKIIKGTAIYSDGAKYIGEYKDNIPHGYGTFTFSDGSQYAGEWKDGIAQGTGIKTWRDGRKYAGEFKNDVPHGQGTFEFPNGSKYVGQYKNGKQHGEGTLTYADGRAYTGQFVDGLEHGVGLCMNQDGSSVECKVLKMEKKDIVAGNYGHNISIVAKKWIKFNEYETASGKGKKVMEQLENDFNKRASELCLLTANFNILEKRLQVLEMDETPAFGLEPKIKLGIDGVIECK